MFPLAQVSTPQLPPLPDGPSLERVRGPIEIPAYTTWQIALLGGLAILVAALFIWAIWKLIQGWQKRRAAIAPAKAAIAELEAAALSQEDERFTVGSVQALRRYFQNGLHITTNGQTSEEFLGRLQQHPRLSQDFKSSLAQFLQDCDAVKFAQRELGPQARQVLTQQALSLIEQAESAKKEASA